MKAYIINPLARSIEQIDFNGDFDALEPIYQKLIGYDVRNCDVSKLNNLGDFIIHLKLDEVTACCIIHPEFVAENFGVFGYYCHQCEKMHNIFGKAIIGSQDMNNLTDVYLKDPTFTLGELKEAIKWGEIVKKDEMTPAGTLTEEEMVRNQTIFH